MIHPRRINRNLRILAVAAALTSAFVASDARSADKNVIIQNVPLPVTGTVNANVTGTVGISGVPSVSPALPAHPFFDEMTLLGNARKAVGVTGQTLAVTTITISNFDANTQQLFVFRPVMSDGDCLSGTVVGGAAPLAHLILEPLKSVQLQYPVPMVFDPIGGLGCIAAEVTTVHTGAVVVGVNGFSVAP